MDGYGQRKKPEEEGKTTEHHMPLSLRFRQQVQPQRIKFLLKVHAILGIQVLLCIYQIVQINVDGAIGLRQFFNHLVIFINLSIAGFGLYRLFSYMGDALKIKLTIRQALCKGVQIGGIIFME